MNRSREPGNDDPRLLRIARPPPSRAGPGSVESRASAHLFPARAADHRRADPTDFSVGHLAGCFGRGHEPIVIGKAGDAADELTDGRAADLSPLAAACNTRHRWRSRLGTIEV
jgi:hypothetical protein